MNSPPVGKFAATGRTSGSVNLGREERRATPEPEDGRLAGALAGLLALKTGMEVKEEEEEEGPWKGDGGGWSGEGGQWHSSASAPNDGDGDVQEEREDGVTGGGRHSRGAQCDEKPEAAAGRCWKGQQRGAEKAVPDGAPVRLGSGGSSKSTATNAAASTDAAWLPQPVCQQQPLQDPLLVVPLDTQSGLVRPPLSTAPWPFCASKPNAVNQQTPSKGPVAFPPPLPEAGLLDAKPGFVLNPLACVIPAANPVPLQPLPEASLSPAPAAQQPLRCAQGSSTGSLDGGRSGDTAMECATSQNLTDSSLLGSASEFSSQRLADSCSGLPVPLRPHSASRNVPVRPHLVLSCVCLSVSV
jgi:hypothetical protein